MARNNKSELSTEWKRFRKSPRFHNALMFLVFVAIASIFWFVVALNDNVTETFKVTLQIDDVADTVTFINDPPADLHVTLRDKGTNILRSGVVKHPTLRLNFHDYARKGLFRVTQAELNAELKSDFGGAAQITGSSLDSLRLYYTNQPGRRVPVKVVADLSAASGYLIAGEPVPLTKSVLVYSVGNEIDTVRVVNTKRLLKSGLSKSQKFKVELRDLTNIRVVPNQVEVQVNVEPLVHKEVYANVEILNMPEGSHLLLFPAKVPVSMYVQMSRFNDDNLPLQVAVDYNDLHKSTRSRLPVKVIRHARSLINVELGIDSVEYTVVR
ncbi:MAG: YbbR-like domain-containing protein [Muribaculaceae bacterium]|nr:YbbR-like domain-containing protein [Muribaculaceae bacterium]